MLSKNFILAANGGQVDGAAMIKYPSCCGSNPISVNFISEPLL